MDDDWDAVATAPSSGAGGVSMDGKGGMKPPGGGRGRGITNLVSQMQKVNVSEDWGAGMVTPVASTPHDSTSAWDTPAPKNNASGDWGAGVATPVGGNPSNDSTSAWDTPKPQQNGWGASNKRDVEDQPRGGGWNSTAGGGGGASGGGWKGSSGGGGNRSCHKCGEEGHMSRECPNGGGGGGGGSRACFKCNEEGHMSRDCPKGGGGGGGNRACHKCGEEGHMSRECPTGGGGGGGNRACHKCGEEGHMSRECPSGGGGGGGGKGCFKCGEEGHMSRECPTGGGGGGGGKCFKCGEEGHMSRECPTAGGGPDAKCYKCHETGHSSKDCTNPFSELTEDGKPREAYIPPEVPSSEEELFKGIKTGSNFINFENVALQVTGSDCPHSITCFEDAGLRPLMLENIKRSGYVKPTPVQKGTIPVIMAKRDLIASAVTGSGKTAAYLVPVLNSLLEQGVEGARPANTQTPEVVIISPTRELAIQIHQEARKFSYNSCIKTVIVYGGTVSSHQRSSAQAGCNILVATPGRLKDFVEKRIFDFSNVKFLIFDEADRMLDMGFGEVIDFILDHPTMPTKGKRQTLMFSATFPQEIQETASKHLENYIFLATGAVGGTNPDVRQEFIEVARNEKRDRLMEILKDIGSAKTIIFVESKKTADFIAAFLCNNEVKATSIHGDRLQSQRETALRDLKGGVRNILVATNVAARGLDIAGVDFVINYELPSAIEEYVHRIGRTGRVGNFGRSISFFDPEKDGPNAGKIVEKLNQAQQDVPSFLLSAVGGVGGMGFNFGAPSGQSNFASRDIRRFDKGGAAPTEAQETWD